MLVAPVHWLGPMTTTTGVDAEQPFERVAVAVKFKGVPAEICAAVGLIKTLGTGPPVYGVEPVASVNKFPPPNGDQLKEEVSGFNPDNLILSMATPSVQLP